VNSLIFRGRSHALLRLRGQCHEPHVTAERAEVLVLLHALPQIGFRLVREREFQVAQCLVALALQGLGSRKFVGCSGRVGMLVAQNAPSGRYRLAIISTAKQRCYDPRMNPL
jgi:hypothetical protein